jgi:hypothetical protein
MLTTKARREAHSPVRSLYFHEERTEDINAPARSRLFVLIPDGAGCRDIRIDQPIVDAR